MVESCWFEREGLDDDGMDTGFPETKEVETGIAVTYWFPINVNTEVNLFDDSQNEPSVPKKLKGKRPLLAAKFYTRLKFAPCPIQDPKQNELESKTQTI